MNTRTRSGTHRPGQTRDSASTLLGIYLNDHLAGATAGADRSRHMVRAYSGTPLAAAMAPIAAEIAEDRASLIGIMKRLDVPVRHYKMYAGRAAERMGRLKSNGRLVRRSPLSPLLELEALRLGVEGKAAIWETLRELADTEKRLDPHLLDELHQRARRQLDRLEELRRQQAGTAFQQT